VGAFAALAMTLAVVGLYGVIAYGVACRTREIGVRIALGADPRSIAGMVLGEGLRLTFAGTAIGLAGGMAMNRVLQQLEPTARAFDPQVIGAVVAALAVAAAVASYVPARRAARVDPATALK
jgi:putative ABC transport system permease protein